MKNNIEGYEKGETCNRDGCIGVIKEHDKEGSCSCHINPPCSICVESRAFCPICDWSGLEEQQEAESNHAEMEKRNAEIRRKQNELFKKDRDEFCEKFNGKLPIDKLDIRCESHTHFSMIRIGIFPPNTETRESLLIYVEGSWGGRFEMFNAEAGKFKYIAYTD